MLRSLLFTLTAGIVGSLVAFHVSESAGRAGILRSYVRGDQPNLGNVKGIVDEAVRRMPRCFMEGSRDELSDLARAIMVAEVFATSSVHQWLKRAYVRAASEAGYDKIDWSMGPARIRPSTAASTIATAFTAEAAFYRGLTREQLTGKLFCACHARKIAVVILQVMHARYGLSNRIDLLFIRQAAREYGGKAQRFRSAESEISAAVYFKVVYDSFLHFRFQRLSEDSPLVM